MDNKLYLSYYPTTIFKYLNLNKVTIGREQFFRRLIFIV